jgi:DNA-binding transcriptional ArsR family regulator
MKDKTIKDAAKLVGMLKSPINQKILTAASEGKNGQQIIAAVNKPQSDVSNRLSKMRSANLVSSSRFGKEVYFQPNDRNILDAQAAMEKLAKIKNGG